MSFRTILLLVLLTAACYALAAPTEEMELLPGGSYSPLYLENETAEGLVQQSVYVEPFWLDRMPVTNRQYLNFVTAHPEWKKSQVKGIFADSRYLRHWSSDLALSDPDELNGPVVNVSWFAASAYCEAQEKRLPTTDEWEYALADNGRDSEKVQQRILDWYAVPNRKLPEVGGQAANGFGISDLATVVWEWTSDFNSFLAPSDSRDSGDKNMFCGGGSLSAFNRRDYAAFMRYSYRASLQGAFTGENLGFRCAKDTK